MDAINKMCMNKIDGEEERVYDSVDSVGLDDVDVLFSKEYLNEREFSGIPPHLLTLKTNIPIILIRNIDNNRGLCNGTRMIIHKLYENFIDARRLTNPTIPVYIPKMILSPTKPKLAYEFKRRQLTGRVDIGVTKNNSQGLRMQNVVVYLT